ncbi:hypothetical protein KKH39_05185 [Patescibacteria group bacterium]|nr:hypothetical protein [Patescibacteria group bacterium]
MKIVVSGNPNVCEVPARLIPFLFGLVLEVDISFSPDGNYHVRVDDLWEAIVAVRCPQAASILKHKLQKESCTHVMIPADCCRIISGSSQTIEA